MERITLILLPEHYIVEQKIHQRMARSFCYTISKTISTVSVCYLSHPGLGWMLVTCAGKSETAGIRMKTPRKSLSIQSNVSRAFSVERQQTRMQLLNLLLWGKLSPSYFLRLWGKVRIQCYRYPCSSTKKHDRIPYIMNPEEHIRAPS